MTDHPQPAVKLKRTLGLPVLTLYGLGTIIGAGIYVLIGKVAAEAGGLMALSFLLAGIIAIFTAFSYAELAARFPRTAGAALYVGKAYRNITFSQIVGWLVIFTGVVSAATIINGFNGYLGVFVILPDTPVKLVLVLALFTVAAWGIKESAVLITIITLLEVGGLVYVFYAGLQSPVLNEQSSVDIISDFGGASGVLIGSFLAFYAFIGFEDMVNVVEEVKEPRKNLPIAIIAAVAIATLLYIAVAVVALRVLPASHMAMSDAPLADLVIRVGISPNLITAISLIAVINGALVQIIMASRVIYGMSRFKMAPAYFGHINAHTCTPVRSTLLVAVIVLGFALLLPLTTLAGLASTIMLVIFAAVNFGLARIKRHARETDHFCVPTWVPITGTLLCLVLLIVRIFS